MTTPPPDPDEVDKALAVFEHATTATVVTVQRAGITLAAAVRELRDENRRLSDFMTGRVLASPDREYYDRAEKAEADLAALKGRTCDSCTFRWPHISSVNGDRDVCGKVSIPGHSVAVVMCDQLGRTCGAWAKKEQQP
jgi:hypothetical protein